MPAMQDLDPGRRRLLYRCWHRGTRELDLLLGRFAEAHMAELSEDDLVELEGLMEVEEKLLFAWLIGTQAAPEPLEQGLVGRMRTFHKANPLFQG